MPFIRLQVRLGAGNVMQNIGVLCCEHLTSWICLTLIVTLFAKTVMSKIPPLATDQPLDQVVECLRAARKKHKPDLREARHAPLAFRYSMAFVNDDYEVAVSVLDGTITSISPRRRSG